jgi:hypothetical protein
MIPDVVQSRAASLGNAHKYVTDPEVMARVAAKLKQLPEDSPQAEYLADLLQEDPGPYVPSAVRLAAENAELRAQLAQVRR